AAAADDEEVEVVVMNHGMCVMENQAGVCETVIKNKRDAEAISSAPASKKVLPLRARHRLCHEAIIVNDDSLCYEIHVLGMP
ncbi:MAG TPA: hypothetical protein PLZ14_08765, partial [Acidovorax temperans]|nr:hypothetical protein [Acidovorax temperans]